MKIGFIGAGKTGFTLGKHFTEHGIPVSGYSSRNMESAKEAAAFTGTAYFETIDSVLAASDILFLTVPDSAIKDVWNRLKTLPIQNKIICHCSGLMSSADFDGIHGYKAFGYSIHPLFAISSKKDSYKEIGQAIFVIEGGKEHLCCFEQIFEKVGNKICIITAQQKAKYHGAAVFLSNHVAALAYVGCKLLNECGFNDAFNQTVLNTLFLNNSKTIAENGVMAALTGPVERNDLTTIKKHLECLPKNEQLLYVLLSRQLAEIAKEKHPDMDYADLALFLEKIQLDNIQGELT